MTWLSKSISLNRRSPTPRYLQVVNAIVQEIRTGRLRQGQRLPGSRDLARQLKLNRMTIVAAYQELNAQGWISQSPRSGSFVKIQLPVPTPRQLAREAVPFQLPATPGFSIPNSSTLPDPVFRSPNPRLLEVNDGFPDPRIAPVDLLVRNLRSQARRAVNRKYLMYGHSQGALPLREALAAFLGDTRGMPVNPDNILVTRGAQMGIYLASSLLLKPGSEVVVGIPGYETATETFQQFGARIIRVAVDENGLRTDRLEALCKRKKITLVYVIPHHHNPTTVALSPDRRLRLLELAAKYRFAILEDDYDYDFHYASQPILPMASQDKQGNVIYVGTLTKTLAPAIRIGFVVGPTSLIQALTLLRKQIDTQGDIPLENAIAEMFRDGTIQRHIKKSVRLYRERRDYFCALLSGTLGKAIRFNIPAGGMSVWAHFPDKDLKTISRKALEKGLVIRDGTDYDSGQYRFNALRLGFASLNYSEQEKVVEILSQCI